jgi:hypothetical protein
VIERRIDAREWQFEGALAIAVIDVQAPASRLRFAPPVLIERIVESVFVIGQIDPAPILDPAIPIPEFEGIDRHR